MVNGFTILGMNVGDSAVDYSLLLNSTPLNPEKKLLDLMEDYNLSKEKDAIIEEIFNYLSLPGPVDIDPNDLNLAELLFNQGWDILENRLKDPGFKELINNHQNHFIKVLQERIKDQYGASHMKKAFPKLCAYLQENYNNELPIDLSKKVQVLEKKISKKSWFKLLYNFFANFFKNNLQDPKLVSKLNSLSPSMQGLKDKLALNFFNNIIKSSERPSVIILQEVYSHNQGIIDTLEEKYEIHRSSEISDTLIAVDKQRFEDVTSYVIGGAQNQSTAAFARDKKTKEEFLFISVHLSGYQLEFPKDPTSDDFNKHLFNVEGRIESGAWAQTFELNRSINTLKIDHPNAKIIIQGDFNTYPDYFDLPQVSEKIKKMNIFESLKQSDLTLHRTNMPTELNRSMPSLQERELDYVLTSNSLANRVKMFDPIDPELSLTNRRELGESERIHFDPMSLFSDHRPIWTRIESEI